MADMARALRHLFAQRNPLFVGDFVECVRCKRLVAQTLLFVLHAGRVRTLGGEFLWIKHTSL